MRYKITRAFGSFHNFSINEIVEFTDAEYLRYRHSLEPIEDESVNFTDSKPNKQYKKGRKKG